MRLTLRLPHSRAEATPPDRDTAPERRLREPWLILTRAAYAAVALLAVGSFTTSLLLRFAHLNTFSDADTPSGWTREAFHAALAQLGLSIGAYHTYRIVLDLTFALCFIAVAVVLLWHKSNEGMALFAALALLTFGALWPTSIEDLSSAYPAWSWLFTIEDQLSLTVLLVFLCLYPDGRFVPRWLSWLLVAWIMSGLLAFFISALPSTLNVLLLLGFLGAVLVAQIYRYRRRSGPVQRQQIKWLVLGFSATLSAVVALLALGVIFPALGRPGTTGLLYEAAGAALGSLLFLPIPLCVGVALLRYRLWDIDILINRTLVYGALTACVIAIYILVVGYLGALFRTGGNLVISLIATGVVALLFQPLRGWLQRGVNRLLYGQRDEPYLVVTRLSQRVESSLAHETILPTIVETVAQALKLPYAAITLREGDEQVIAATYGTSKGDALRLPLIYQAAPIGELILSPRAQEVADMLGELANYWNTASMRRQHEVVAALLMPEGVVYDLQRQLIIGLRPRPEAQPALELALATEWQRRDDDSSRGFEATCYTSILWLKPEHYDRYARRSAAEAAEYQPAQRSSITKEQRERALALLGTEQSLRHIADHVGISYWAVLRLAQRFADPDTQRPSHQRPKLSAAEQQAVVGLLVSGMSLRAVAKQFDVSYASIDRIKRRQPQQQTPQAPLDGSAADAANGPVEPEA